MREGVKSILTQAEVVDCVSDGVDLQVLPVVLAGEAHVPRQVATTGERLVHALSIDLQAWHLIHWHAFARRRER